MTETIAVEPANRVVLVAAGSAQDRREFFFGFAIDAPEHLVVLVDGTPADPRPVVTPWPNATGGTVVFDDPLPQGAVLVLERVQPIARLQDLSASTGVSAGQVNAELDLALRHLAGLADRTRQRLGSTITAGSAIDGLLPEPGLRAGRAIGFDPDGRVVLRSRADQRGQIGATGPSGSPGSMRGANNLAELTDPVLARTMLDLPSRADLLAGLEERRDRLDRLALNLISNAFRDAARRDMARLSLVDGVLDLLVDTDGVDLAASSGLAHSPSGRFLSNETPGGSGQAFLLRALPVELEETPETVRMLLLMQAVDPAPEPDGLVLQASRTGGLDWTALPAPESFPFAEDIRLLACGPVSLADQPDGNALVWRILSDATARRRIHGWALLWA